MVWSIRRFNVVFDRRFPGGVEQVICPFDIKFLSLRPGSLLIIKVHQEIDQEMADKIREATLSQMPSGMNVLVFDKNIDICAVLQKDFSLNARPISK